MPAFGQKASQSSLCYAGRATAFLRQWNPVEGLVFDHLGSPSTNASFCSVSSLLRAENA